jgi:2-haloacid dehalogenase
VLGGHQIEVRSSAGLEQRQFVVAARRYAPTPRSHEIGVARVGQTLAMPELDLATATSMSFDCYGTLADWETGILAALRPWAERNGITPSDDELLAAYSRSEPTHQTSRPALRYREVLRRVHADIAREFGVEPLGADADAFAAAFDDWPVFDDVPDALRSLQERAKLIILSNVDRSMFFDHTAPQLGVEFDAVITAEDVDAYKPAAAHFERLFDTIDGWGLDRTRHVHVAESLRHDIEPANRFGIASVWVDRRAGAAGGASRAVPVDATPDLIVHSLSELVEHRPRQ